MATTSNWGWPTPDDSDAVSQGAAAIRSLGSAIDTTVGKYVDYTPTLTNLTLGNGTLIARYARIGDTITGYIVFTLGSTSSVGTSPEFSSPTGISAAYNIAPIGQVVLEDSDGSERIGWLRALGDDFLPRRVTVSGSDVVDASITATTPFTWATGDRILITFTYQSD